MLHNENTNFCNNGIFQSSKFFIKMYVRDMKYVFARFEGYLKSISIFSAGVSRLQIDALRTSWCFGEEREKSLSRGERQTSEATRVSMESSFPEQ